MILNETHGPLKLFFPQKHISANYLPLILLFQYPIHNPLTPETDRDINFKTLLYVLSFKFLCRDFPGSPVVSNAGDTGLIPVWGTKIPHATGQLTPHATTREPA